MYIPCLQALRAVDRDRVPVIHCSKNGELDRLIIYTCNILSITRYLEVNSIYRATSI